MDDVLPPAFLVISDTMDAQAALSERERAILRRLGAVRVVCAQAPPRTTLLITT